MNSIRVYRKKKNLHGTFIDENPCPEAGTVIIPDSDVRTTVDRLAACSGASLLMYLSVPKKHDRVFILNSVSCFSRRNETSSQIASTGTAFTYNRNKINTQLYKTQRENLQQVNSIDQRDESDVSSYLRYGSIRLKLNRE